MSNRDIVLLICAIVFIIYVVGALTVGLALYNAYRRQTMSTTAVYTTTSAVVYGYEAQN
ncbi:MAG: hypothetical protein VB111_07150 [Clostridiaceae bacterium]|nr:hypothetical protein [Clostridiaceae bacterium]